MANRTLLALIFALLPALLFACGDTFTWEDDDTYGEDDDVDDYTDPQDDDTADDDDSAPNTAPEAESGDTIFIDIPSKKIELKVDPAELESRRQKWQPPAPKITSGYVARYARLVTSGSTGAVLKDD